MWRHLVCSVCFRLVVKERVEVEDNKSDTEGLVELW